MRTIYIGIAFTLVGLASADTVTLQTGQQIQWFVSRRLGS
jgi:hypothetical protein